MISDSRLTNFLTLPAGTYSIGAKRETLLSIFTTTANLKLKEEYLLTAAPEHEAAVSALAISKRPVTISEFSPFIEETGYVTEAEKDGWGWIWDCRWLKKEGVSWRSPFGCSADDMYQDRKDIVPVSQISWNDAMQYCKWRSEKLLMTVRLPGEHEWEAFASLNGAKSMRDIKPGESVNDFSDTAAYVQRLIQDSEQEKTFGIVWEWCDDWFEMYPQGTPNRDFGRTYRVLRGGSLLSHPAQRTREFRFRRCPTARSPYYGFRIALSSQ